jgi:hypothetical protein
MVALEEDPEERRCTISQMLSDHRPTPEESVERCQLSELVTKLIGGLPDPQRSTLRLRCDDFSIREVAEVLGVPVGTVKARLARGRAKLMERFHKATSATRSRILGPDFESRLRSFVSGRRVVRGTNPNTAQRQRGGGEGWVRV